MTFDYEVHDGQWHSLALDVRGRRVFLHTSCGRRSLQADLRSKDQALDPEGLFLLGRMNRHSVAFEGAVCQFDIYPAAKAAHNYCDYIKKQCRDADTYRPVFPALLPLFSTDPNITLTRFTPPPQGPTLATIAGNARTTLAGSPTKTSAYDAGSPLVPSGFEGPPTFPTQTVATSFRIEPKPTSQVGRNAKRNDPDSQRPSGNVPASTAASDVRPTRGLPADGFAPREAPSTTASPKPPEPEVASVQDVTPAATDGFQTFDLEPTQFSLLAGSPGPKGEPGPQVSV